MSIYNSIKKHKRFTDVLPYTYYIKHILSNTKYYGVRWANKVSPLSDFGIKYHTSGKFKEEFKYHPERFEYRLCWTFDHKDDAILYENKIITRVYRKNDWANNNAYPAFYNQSGPNTGNKVTEEQKILRRKQITGRRGFNNGSSNFLLFPNDPKAKLLDSGYTQAFKNKVTASAKNRPPRTQEYKENMSRSCKGKKVSDTTKERMKISNSQDAVGRSWYNDGAKNYRLTPDDKRRKVLSKGRLLSENHREKIIKHNKSEGQRRAVSVARTSATR